MLRDINKQCMGLLTEHEKFVKISLLEEGNLTNRKNYQSSRTFLPLQEPNICACSSESLLQRDTVNAASLFRSTLRLKIAIAT
jgi:hypothetical protein